MMYTLVPLGNPGKEYEHTRHNAGRILMTLLSSHVEALDTIEVFIPDTYMNESGRAIAEYLRYHEGRELVVMYDDKDLPLGTLRISYDRGDGGHRGLKSIIDALGARDFIRIRIGIAPLRDERVIVPHGEEVQSFVLGRFTEDEESVLREVATRVLGALRVIIADGYQKAMERYN